MNTTPLDGRPGAPDGTALTNSGVRRFAGLPEVGLPEAGARAAGRRLATHPLLTARSTKGDEAIPDVLRDAHYLLSGVGVQFEVLRTRPGCAVARAIPDPSVSPVAACQLVQGLLETVSEAGTGVGGTIVETTCAARGSPSCLYTVMWESAAEPAAGPARPVAPRAAATAPTVHLDAPAAAPVDAYRYLGQVTPAPPVPESAPNRVSTAAPVERPPAAPVAPSPPPAPPVPSAPMPVPAVAPPVAMPVSVMASEPRPSAPSHSPPAHRTGRKAPIWLFRRSWLLAVALVAGTAGGFVAAKHSPTSYSATSTLVVQSGAGRAGPGSANDAQALATTYAALIPKDQAILQVVAGTLHVSTDTLARHLSVSVEMGTSLLLVKYSAPTASQALDGSTLLARTVAGSAAPTPAIASGSLVIVQLPASAVAGGALHKYGAPIGALFGLLLGIVLVLAAERADPRVDDTFTLGQAAGCAAASLPADLSLPELARALARATGGATLTVVPLAEPDAAPAMAIARRLGATMPPTRAGTGVALSPSFSSGAVELSRGTGPTILVLRAGRRQRDVSAAAERLRLMGREPLWAVLVGKRTDQDVSTYDR